LFWLDFSGQRVGSARPAPLSSWLYLSTDAVTG
jgi:hypothetical protein